MKNNKNIIYIIVLVLILLGGGYYAYLNMGLWQAGENSEGSGYTVEDLSSGVVSNIPVPDLDRMIIVDESLSEEVVVAIKSNINTLSTKLKEDSNQFELWLDLGIYRKTAGDYEGAIAAWEYAGAIRPGNSTSFQNLGDLYGYYLHDAAKAEQNFLQAIKNGPSEVYLYFKTADFYKDVMKDIAKARAIAQQGVDANPDSQDLKDLLNSL